MNYRHGFHAGNFADVLKHAVLARILDYLKQKEGAFRVVDTHAGAGLYDLAGDEASRTLEARDGIDRIDRSPLAGPAEALLAPWRAALAAARTAHRPSAYPGSPWLVRHALREQDRLVAAELHPPTFARLEGALGRDRRCKALAIDGWHALRGNVPPKERRGLVLIDPPFEKTDEFDTLAVELIAAHRKWPGGVYAIWYPQKDRRAAAGLVEALGEAGIGRLLRLSLDVDRPEEAGGLSATGMLIINPPWTLANEMEVLLPALAGRLAQGPRPRYAVEPIRPDG